MRSVTPLMFLLLACGDAKPCSDCPAIQGSYAVTWKRAVGSQDCASKGPQPATLQLTQNGSVMRSMLGDAVLQGTLYDTYDFTLSGNSFDHFALKARAVVDSKTVVVDGGTRADGGVIDGGVQTTGSVHLVGTLTTSPGDGGCDVRDDFTGDRL